MIATVVTLDSRRRNQPPAYCCPRHRLDALVDRSLAELSGTEDALLIPRSVLVAVVEDLAATVRAALVENGERTTR